MKSVDLSSITNDEIAIRIGRALKEEYGASLKVKTSKLAVAHLPDIGTAASIASLVLGIFSLTRKHFREKKWSLSKLKEIVEESLLTKGVVEYRIISITYFEKMKRSPIFHCTVIVEEIKSGNRFEIIIFGDGDASTIRIS